MSKSVSDELLEQFTRGFAFDESVRQQLSYKQMIALADMFWDGRCIWVVIRNDLHGSPESPRDFWRRPICLGQTRTLQNPRC